MRADRVLRDWAYATRRQLRALAPASPDGYGSGDRQPIVVLPGVYETWHFLQPIMDVLHRAGHPIVVVPSLRYNLRPVPESAELVMEEIRARGLRDAIVLAHSKGGLIGKYAMTRLDPDGLLTAMVAIATPFAGSVAAAYAPVRHLRIFRATDPVLAALARELDVNARVTSIWGVDDTLVPNGSELPGATNVRLAVPGHFGILGDPRTIAAVVEAVERSAGAGA